MEEGSANVFLVETDEKRYIFKQFQQKYKLEDVINEPEINRILKHNGIPTARFFKTNTEEDVWLFNQRVYHLQEFIDGINYRKNDAPEWLLEKSANYLGQIHTVLSKLSPL